ncbi:MAG: ABC transporter permease [Lachnospirales bacterium]
MGRRSFKEIINKYKVFLMLLPFICITFITLILGTAEMIKESLGYIPFFNMKEITFKYYIEVLSDKEFYKSLFYTIYLSFLPTIIALSLGTFFAIYCYYLKAQVNKLNFIIQIPIVIPYIVYSFFVIIIFMQSGFLSRILYSLNIVTEAKEFPLLIYDEYGIGIFLVYILKQVPFVYLIINTGLLKVDKKLLYVSFNLGATKIKTTFNIVLPIIKKNIITAGLLCFAFNFSSFEVPFLLLNPKIETLPILAYKKYISSNMDYRVYSMVINTLILIVASLLLIRYLKYMSNSTSESKGK